VTPNDEQGRAAPLLAGFTILLAALFAVAFGIGRLAGPVAPGMHRVAPGTTPAPTAPATHGTHDMPGMPGMDMGGGQP
jgi:hypothetical protein